MDKTLVIMAAGLASRYGGAKQIEKVGPGGEILMEYAVHDAAKAGFDRFVVILQPNMLEDFREVCGKRLENSVAVDYAFQSFDALPDWFSRPADRKKPYGTVAAVLSGKDAITGRFAVLNADDYYGPGAFNLMAESLDRLPEQGGACMVAYRLKNTVSENGVVTRGVCTLEDGYMTHVEETFQIGLAPDGSIRSFLHSEQGLPLDEDSAVSMNFWGCTPWILEEMEGYFHDFLRSGQGRELGSECLLPTMIEDMIREGRLRVAARTTGETWFGMTYREDRATTARMLRELTDRGIYPEILF